MRRLVVCGAVAAALSGCGGNSSSAHHLARETPSVAAPAATAFGATVNTLFNVPLYTPAQVSADLAALSATGATLARSDVLWEKVETSPPSHGVHHYNWSFDDTIAGALAAQGLTWLPILDYAANWAKAVPSQLHSPPRSGGEFATFAAAFAARYGFGGAFWRAHPQLTPKPVDTYEVWNEPDGNFWYPVPNAAAYAALYMRTRDAIDAVAPGSRVIVGGLAHPPGFLAEMLAARPALAGHLDGVAIHVYRTRPADVIAAVRAVRRSVDAAGMASVPIYLTEFGWAAPPSRNLRDRLLKRARPRYIAATVSGLGRSNCGLAAIVLFSWVTEERDPAQLDQWYGIDSPLPGAGSTPETRAFTDAVRVGSAPGPRTELCAP